MKKTTIIIVLFFTSAIVFAQQGRVGINTETPKTTLDVSGKIGTDGKSLTTDMTGLQAPRITRAELTDKGDTLYGQDQKGALIYITDISGGNAGVTTPRKNITTIGYYYFDGTDWIKIGSGSADTSIYTVDGNITGTSSPGNIRTLNLNGNAMTFTGTQERTYWSPTGVLSQNNIQATGGSSNFLLYGGGNTLLSLQQFRGSNAQIYASTGSTGLDIGTNAITNASGAPIKFFTSAGSSALGTEKARIQPDGKIGIGEITPTNTLHVKASADPVKFEGLQTSSNNSDKVLVADANGVLKTTSLFIPFTSLIGTKVNQDSTSGTASTFKAIIMENNPVIAGMSYNATTGVYTVTSPGYYQISALVSANVANPGDGTASFALLKNGSRINRIDTGYGTGSTFTNQNMTYLVQFAANDTFSMEYAFTRTFRITTAQVSVIKVGN